MDEKVFAPWKRRTSPYTFLEFRFRHGNFQYVGNSVRTGVNTQEPLAWKKKTLHLLRIPEFRNSCVFKTISTWGSTDTDTHRAAWESQTRLFVAIPWWTSARDENRKHLEICVGFFVWEASEIHIVFESCSRFGLRWIDSCWICLEHICWAFEMQTSLGCWPCFSSRSPS